MALKITKLFIPRPSKIYQNGYFWACNYALLLATLRENLIFFQIDFMYVRPQHIPSVNRLARDFFWPGIDREFFCWSSSSSSFV
jgi:hypothetical protein